VPPGKLIYLLNASLDGYVETPDHSLDWTKVDDELHTWFNDQIRGLDALIYGRRTYELMASYWPTAESDVAATAPVREFARLWCALPKIVLSRSLGAVEGEQPAPPRRGRRRIHPHSTGVFGRPRRRRTDPRGVVHRAGPGRRVPAGRPPGDPRRRHAVFPAARPSCPAAPDRNSQVRFGCRISELRRPLTRFPRWPRRAEPRRSTS